MSVKDLDELKQIPGKAERIILIASKGSSFNLGTKAGVLGFEIFVKSLFDTINITICH